MSALGPIFQSTHLAVPRLQCSGPQEQGISDVVRHGELLRVFKETTNPVRAKCSGAVFAPPRAALVVAPPSEDHVVKEGDTAFVPYVSGPARMLTSIALYKLTLDPTIGDPVGRA